MTTLLPFASDYMEGTYPAILEKLTAMNFTAQSGYGTDKISTSAKDKIRQACTAPTEKSIFSTVVPRPMPSSSMPCYTATKGFSPPRRDMSASMKPVPSNTRGTKSSSCRRHKENC